MNAAPQGVDPSLIPMSTNPSGAPSNFINPPSLKDSQFAGGLTLIILSTVFLIFRAYTNLRLTRRLFIDDYLCFLAHAGGIVYFASQRKMCEAGIGRHSWDTSVAMLTDQVMQNQILSQMIIAPTLWAAKSAILALYLRIFGKVKWLRISSYIWIFLMAIIFGLNIVISGVFCVPRSGEAWADVTFKRCSDSAWISLIVGVFAVIADLVILLLPFPIIMHLRLSTSKKIHLGIVFSTGVILVALSVVSLALRVIIYEGKDPFWYGILLGIISTAEVSGTVIVSCAPAVSAYWFKIFTKSTVFSLLQKSMIWTSPSSTSVATESTRGRPSTSGSAAKPAKSHVVEF
ncbi:hypothetical protein EJ05DRAFT_487244 [Pseudovirgaria hyperparasitica]|uniref:Rhodopsin domain-containing protein n=1 Tax=Pseudovirgaria hyperparasitica TaxID=470096 RepID=A0A6A6W078_9PEZI|nr:uncharacterized protein EJ05DRAFT_487244 [Pseudovirgaria hyperparasitica]KAF2756328.1 hypothetical protein EJ05DRAFT_487244 [Pseudovirgaria hyperparasitica]